MNPITRRENYVAPIQTNIHDNERGIIESAVNASADMVAHRQMSHFVRADDDAVSQAKGSLLYSLAYSVAAGMITGGILLMAWIVKGGEGSDYAILFLVIWGVCILISLAVNRWQGLYHSATGIAHHEIQSRENLAYYAIDKHVELIEKRWQLDKK